MFLIIDSISKIFHKYGLFAVAVFMLFSFVAVTLIAAVLFNKIKGQQKIISIKQAIELASNYGNFVKNSIEKDLVITQTLANNVSNYNDISYKVRRECFRATHKITFLKNPQIYNLYTVCERNSIDKEDAANERFYYSTFRTNSKKFYEKNEIYYNPEDEDWYTIPKNKQEDYISEPYYWKYPYSSDRVLEISIISPIISNDKFIGVVGIDKRLDTLQSELANIKPFDEGFVFLLSNNGMVVSYPDKRVVGKSFFSTLSLNKEEIVNNSLKGGYSETFRYEGYNDREYLVILLPVKFGNSKKYWSIGISIPYEFVLKPVVQYFIGIIITGSVVIFLLIFLIMVIWNHTLNKRVEEKTSELKMALNKAEEANNLKTAFLNNISHEIRTPLNGIMGFSEILISNSVEMSTMVEYQSILTKSIDRLLVIMDDIIDISKIHSGQLQIYMTQINLFAFISEVEADTILKIEKSGKKDCIIFSVKNLIPEVKASMRTDYKRLKQVIDNVIDNAIKFTDKGEIELLVQCSEKEVVFEIFDTGKGVSEDIIPIIFDSFRKSSDFNTGIGLGLSISKGIVQLLKGDIYMKSEINKGTKIFISIPY
ncbi:MAG: hypothetical protein JW717_01790 [Marinilabiliaceae bacterium]|nr:hypothetical protein [Marinilabiliaceae bacterium]